MNAIDLLAPSVSHRFLVTFMINGIPDPLDIGFQRVSGLSRELTVTPHRQGGDNARNLYLADRIQHGTLSLERGVMPVSPLTWTFNRVMSGAKVRYMDVIIIVFDEFFVPACNWVISNALPVQWRVGDLDANSNSVLINHLELRYQDLCWLGIRA
nr:hypothetical protein HUO10_005026 [Paraburkholderia busanensis]